jgi:hypothetical protein
MTHTKPRDFLLSRGLKFPFCCTLDYKMRADYLAWDPEADLGQGMLRNPVLDTSREEKFEG